MNYEIEIVSDKLELEEIKNNKLVLVNNTKKFTNGKVGVYVNIDFNLHKKLKAFALIHDMTMQQAVELLIDNFL